MLLRHPAMHDRKLLAIAELFVKDRSPSAVLQSEVEILCKAIPPDASNL